MTCFSRILLSIAILLLVNSVGVAKKTTLVFSTHLQPGTDLFKVTFEIMDEALKRSGYSFKLDSYPGKRALMLSNSGRNDGEAHRIYDIVDNYPNLIRIPEVQQVVYNHAYSVKPIHLKNGWPDFAPYKVAVQRGSVLVTDLSAKNAMSVQELDSIEKVLEYVAIGRADIAIGVPTVIDQILQKEEFAGYEFKRAEPPLTALPIFAYLHKKHKDIVPLIAQSMHEMKLDGTYKRIIQGLVRRE
jgi:polar amino acid transport system substrate-binding protein